MKKLIRFTFAQLEESTTPIEASILSTLIAKGNGTANNPYTWGEFDMYMARDMWAGGYVEGMGYVIPEVNVYGTRSTYNVNDAVSYFNNHYTGTSSTSKCATAIRLALEHAGINMWNQSATIAFAYQYNNALPNMGFSVISVNPNCYTPQAGDIVVFGAITNHTSGHIQMWNGAQWRSDFKQDKFWASPAYEDAYNGGTGTVTIYRRF